MYQKILLIDDDELLLAALDSFLIFEHFLTRTVAKAELIESAVVDFMPDLILMDICLDTADGRIICDGLKLKASTSHIPILLLTGLSYDEIASIDCQADAIMGKPYNDKSLLHAIRHLLVAK